MAENAATTTVVPAGPLVSARGLVKTYTMGQVYHFDVNVNFQQNDWTFYENGLALGAGTFNASSNVLRSIRFNYDATGPNISGTAIDNVTVTVPEPNLTSLVMAIGAAYTLWQRRPRVF